MTQTAIIPGSLLFVATQSRQSIAESFVNADAVILVDVSGSMERCDSRGGRSRYQVACEELARLQRDMPGKIAVMAFSDHTEFCPGGVPTYLGGGTNMAGALRFAKVADVPGMKFYLISDGYPDDPGATLREARRYTASISTVYVGPESECQGRNFLAQLAAAAGGETTTAACVNNLAAKLTPLLRAGK
jgi:Mg-chelatase subunit ChlD